MTLPNAAPISPARERAKEIPENGKPSERAGRKAMGANEETPGQPGRQYFDFP